MSGRGKGAFAAVALAAIAAILPAGAGAQVRQPVPQPRADQPSSSKQLIEPTFGATGDWGGLRTDLRDNGVQIDFSALGEIANNVAGGRKHDVTEVSGFSLGLTIDTGKLFGLQGGTFETIFTKRQGYALGTTAGLGLLQPVQEIYARGQTYRLSDLWYMQKIGAVTDVKVGHMTMGEDFATPPCDTMNLTFCGNPAGNLVSDYRYNGPISQWARRVQTRPGDFSFIVGVYEFNPNNLQTNIAINHSGAKGVTVPVEAGCMPRIASHGLPGSYRVGFWYNTTHADDVLTGTFSEDPETGPKATHGLSVLLNVTQTDRRTTRTDNRTALWLVYAGPLKIRPSDDMGIGIGRTHVNGRAAEAEVLAVPGSERPRAEYASGLYYGFHAQPWLILRPTVQYIINPGGYHTAHDVVVRGLQNMITL